MSNNTHDSLRGIECPKCHSNTRVVRTNNLGWFIRRTRLCLNDNCLHAFNTNERITKTPTGGWATHDLIYRLIHESLDRLSPDLQLDLLAELQQIINQLTDEPVR
ncbi:MAG: hypothetical protein J0L94_01050 [Rhodothermia bacterium]|nr:hypothetical protein [Rhodothermia bacterium]